VSLAPKEVRGHHLTSASDVEEFTAALKGEEELLEFCEKRRPSLLSATAAEITEMLTTLLPEVDKRALLDSNDLGSYM
jgi:hypothetical protein